MRSGSILTLLLLAGCAVRGPTPRKPHPASAAAQPGRLAPVTPSLEPGTVTYPGVTRPRADP